MTYQELMPFLELNHCYFNFEKTIGKGGEKITGLVQYCAPIISSLRLERLKEILDDKEWSICYMPNVQELQIRKIDD